MQAPFSRYRRSTGRLKHCAFQATPAPDAVHVSRIRQWYPWWDMGYIGLLADVEDVQPKMSWIKQPALPSQHGKELWHSCAHFSTHGGGLGQLRYTLV